MPSFKFHKKKIDGNIRKLKNKISKTKMIKNNKKLTCIYKKSFIRLLSISIIHHACERL
jgi:hypothetical protein